MNFTITQLIAVLALNLILSFTNGGTELYFRLAIMLNGISGLLILIPMVFLYRRDRRIRISCGILKQQDRSLFAGEIILLLLFGAALSFYGNYLMNMLSILLDPSDYFERMAMLESGYSLGELVFWIGLVGPLTEEGIFRWLIYLRLRDYFPDRQNPADEGAERSFKRRVWIPVLLSSLLFGAYHGSLLQFLYAGLLGFCFALILEWTGNIWSTVLLHIGANILSLLVSEWLANQPLSRQNAISAYLLVTMLAVLVYGFRYFRGMGRDHAARLE